MPKKTLQQVLAQIESLQKEAEILRSSEVKEVIARIQDAIKHYGLTAEDLFPTIGRGRQPRSVDAAIRKTRRTQTSKRTIGVPKYKDPSTDKTWTGQGKRPAWFVQAVDAGARPEELLIG